MHMSRRVDVLASPGVTRAELAEVKDVLAVMLGMRDKHRRHVLPSDNPNEHCGIMRARTPAGKPLDIRGQKLTMGEHSMTQWTDGGHRDTVMCPFDVDRHSHNAHTHPFIEGRLEKPHDPQINMYTPSPTDVISSVTDYMSTGSCRWSYIISRDGVAAYRPTPATCAMSKQTEARKKKQIMRDLEELVNSEGGYADLARDFTLSKYAMSCEEFLSAIENLDGGGGRVGRRGGMGKRKKKGEGLGFQMVVARARLAD